MTTELQVKSDGQWKTVWDTANTLTSWYTAESYANWMKDVFTSYRDQTTAHTTRKRGYGEFNVQLVDPTLITDHLVADLTFYVRFLHYDIWSTTQPNPWINAFSITF